MQDEHFIRDWTAVHQHFLARRAGKAGHLRMQHRETDVARRARLSVHAVLAGLALGVGTAILALVTTPPAHSAVREAEARTTQIFVVQASPA